MSIVLSVYSQHAFKSFLLPSINNSEYSIIISKELFVLERDIELQMEIIGDQWFFASSDKYQIQNVKEKQDAIGRAIQNQDLYSVILSNGTNLSVMVDENENSFQVYDKYDITGISDISVGKNEDNDIQYDNRNIISGHHALIRRSNNQWIIEDKSSNGIFINSSRLVGTRQLSFGDVINCFGLTIVFLKDMIAVGSLISDVHVNSAKLSIHSEPVNETSQEKKRTPDKPVFRRSPRTICKIDTDSVEIESPPNPKEIIRKPVGLLIGPSLTMALPMVLGGALAIYGTRSTGSSAGAFMYTGLITAISSAVVGTVWSVVNMIQEKKRNREEELHRFEAYGEYLIKCSNTIKQKYEKNISNLNTMYRPALECCGYNEKQSALWNRNVKHEDFLFHRLGMGDMPFQVNVVVPKERFTLINDSLAEKPRMIKESYKTLHNVPLCVDLKEHRIIGIVGGSKKQGAVDVMHLLVAQIAASNCYTDVKMGFIYDAGEDDTDSWDYMKWFPHVWSEDRKTRFVARNAAEKSDVLYEITQALRVRYEERSNSEQKKFDLPQFVLFVSGAKLLEGELINKYIYDEKNTDITVVFLVENVEELPNLCTYIIENDDYYKGMYSVFDDDEDRSAIEFDYITDEQLEIMARTLADIRVKETGNGGDIPSSLTFFDMYGISKPQELKVVDKWLKNRTYDSMKALVGQKAGGVDWFLDIHEKYHGPHGLIAGTTGSGKSETLQTYILSLAINFSPDDVGFFIIDYKGGGMANLFNGLPHMIGQISNLSGNQVKRAMVSIKSENKRRQRIFNEHGVNNINLYTRLYKNNEASIPIPHMFIIIDEFAELKREEPDFMRELISVAQVGRSLGVHLILATQKPSGTVDDNIWSNSKFRLCLRVQDRQDSNDMLHRPDAAYITQAGRCYMQVGNDELFELFQSGYSGATYDEEMGSAKLDIATMVSTTGKAALIGNRLKFRQKENAKIAWIQLLTNELLRNFGSNLSTDLLGDDFIAQLGTIFEKDGIDYALNEYGIMRIKDLISAIEGSTSNNASDIIVYADENKLKLPEKKEKTQLDAVIEYLATVAKEEGYNHNMQLWLPVLPSLLYVKQLAGYDKEGSFYDGNSWPKLGKDWKLEVPMGMYDDPVNQVQSTFVIDFSKGGHHAVIGTIVSGKSTFVQTLIYGLTNRYTPDYVNIYILDFSAKMLTSFAEMPHVGGVIVENEDEKVGKFFNMISGIINDRKSLFAGGNYSQYVRVNGVTIPSIVICIDNYANFVAKTNGLYDEIMMQLAKEGISYGIFLVITGGGFGASDIPSRFGENLRTVVCLELKDKFQYGDVMHCMHIDTVPEVNIKGRGLAYVGERILEYQTALAFEAADDFSRMDAIEKLAKEMKHTWTGRCAKAIPVIPENPVWADFEQLDEVRAMLEDDRHLPIGYNAVSADVYGIDLSRTYCYMIAGRGRSGKTNMLKAMICSAHKRGKVTLIDYSGELNVFAESLDIPVIHNDQELFRYFKDDLTSDFVARNKVKLQMDQNGSDSFEIYSETKSFGQNFIFIADLATFVTHIHRPDEGVDPMDSFLKTLLEKGSYHNVYWIAAFNPDAISEVRGRSTFEVFSRYNTGIWFGGNVATAGIMDFSYLNYTEQQKTTKLGLGLLSYDAEDPVRSVVVPLVKGQVQK